MKSQANPPPRPGRPFLFLNAAMTADGKIATANRVVSSFGSPRDLDHLYELRATADAVMAGARTIDSDAVALGTGGARYRRQRLKHGLAEHNLRIIVSGAGTISPHAHIFQKHFSPLLVLTTERMSQRKREQLTALGAQVKVCGQREINFPAALRWLSKQWHIRRLLCEGGGALNSALFRADLVDEINLTVCPKIFGGRAAPTLADGIGFSRLADAAQFQLQTARRIGDEMFLVYTRLR